MTDNEMLSNEPAETIEVPIDLDALEEIAIAATDGPWQWDEKYDDGDGTTGLALLNGSRAEVVGAYNHRCCAFRDDPKVEDCDAKHIAAFDPPTVLALIARLRRAEAVVLAGESPDPQLLAQGFREGVDFIESQPGPWGAGMVAGRAEAARRVAAARAAGGGGR